MREVLSTGAVSGSDLRDAGRRASRTSHTQSRWEGVRRLAYQCRHALRSPHGFVRAGISGMKGLPLFGSLRMLSLGFLPDRQITYGFGAWPSRRRAKLFYTDLQRERMFFSSAVRMSYRALLDDKVRFAELIGSFAETPKLLAVIESGRLFVLSADVPTADAEGLIAAARSHDGLVMKPRGGWFGSGILLLLDSDGRLRLNREVVQPATLAQRIRRLDSYIVTPRVRQAQYAAALYGKTTNTIRMVTMVDPANGEAFVAMAGQRVGTEVSFPVDNAARGGLCTLFDLESGRMSAGVSGDGTRYVKHPDSGAQIEGVTVPRWCELLDSVRRLAQKLDFIDYIGWDLVVTDEGFCVIEGNYNPGLAEYQFHHPLLTNERVRAFYEHHLSSRPSRPRGKERGRLTGATAGGGLDNSEPFGKGFRSSGGAGPMAADLTAGCGPLRQRQ